MKEFKAGDKVSYNTATGPKKGVITGMNDHSLTVQFSGDYYMCINKYEAHLALVIEEESKPILQIEKGKYYEDGLRRKHGPMMRCVDQEYPWTDGLMSWTNTGHYWADRSNSRCNLVSEIPAPLPPDYKAQLAAKHPSLSEKLLATQPEFAAAAEALAQKLAHALLENGGSTVKRRPKQSIALFEAACVLLARAGANTWFNEFEVEVYRAHNCQR